MDPITEMQYDRMAAAMADQDIEIELVRTAAGGIDYISRSGVVLTLGDDNHVDRVTSHLGGHRVDLVSQAERSAGAGRLVELKISGMSVGEAIDRVAAKEATRAAGAGRNEPPPGRVGPDHIIHICRCCPATEPKPMAPTTTPKPPVRGDQNIGHGVLVAVCDTGLTPFDAVQHPWMAGVVAGPGTEDAIVLPLGPNGVPHVDKYVGHGTFVAGVVRTMAPGADVVVGNHMQTMEGASETFFTAELASMIDELPRTPDILVLSAGTLTKDDLEPFAWTDFKNTVLARHPGMVLISAAGNNGDDRPFWPAAAPWATGVGALKSDQVTRAAFSDFGDSADVYVQGENMVNVFPTGVYTYDEQDAGTTKTFTGMASWDGTSFSAPLFAGMVAARMSRHEGEQASDALTALLKAASGAQGVGGPGPGPLLRWEEDV